MINFKNKKQGSVLFLVLILSLIGGILISGLFMAYYRMTKIIFPVRTYSTLREAAAGTVTLLASYIDQKYFSRIDQDSCPRGTEEVGNSSAIRCCKAKIEFKLVGYPNTFPAESMVCLLSLTSQTGYSALPVVGGGGMTISANCDNYPCVYSITSHAYGPQGITSYVETVYVR